MLATHLDLPIDVLTPAEIAARGLRSANTLVVPDAPGAAPLSATALGQIQQLVARGGRFIGVRDRGIAVAAAAGISTTTGSHPDGLLVPGAALDVSVDTTDPVGWGMAPTGFAFNDADPVLDTPPEPMRS